MREAHKYVLDGWVNTGTRSPLMHSMDNEAKKDRTCYSVWIGLNEFLDGGTPAHQRLERLRVVE